MQSRVSPMTDELREEARAILGSLPCSIEMPAGTGKTELIVAMASEAAANGERALILTHTNAGVDALRKRLARHRVSPTTYHVDTITGWAVDLVRHYPTLSGVSLPAAVNPDDSELYILGATRVARVEALVRMHRVSFRYLFVDEYQDCIVEHHDLVVALAAAIPQCAILGDPLQGIFDFRGSTLIDWSVHVHSQFPEYIRTYTPWRWINHNVSLGQWLLDIRPLMVADGTLDLSTVRIQGLEWKPAGSQNEIKAAYAAAKRAGSTVILHQVREQHKTVAGRTGGLYSIMESLNGSYMRDLLQKLQDLSPDLYAAWLAMAAKNCFSGLADVKPTDIVRLQKNQTLIGLKRPTVNKTVAAIESVRLTPTFTALSQAMYEIASAGEGTCYAHEAWFDIAKALAKAGLDPSQTPCQHLGMIRNRLRYSGRKTRERMLSRTLLVKGLEYDHVIIANADSIGDYKDLYVAMTRPRKTLTILSQSPIIKFK